MSYVAVSLFLLKQSETSRKRKIRSTEKYEQLSLKITRIEQISEFCNKIMYLLT